MDRPMAYLFDLYYEWVLDSTNPKGAAEDGLVYFPRFYKQPFGMGWNLRWYRDLADRTGLTADEGLVTVSPAKMIPASYLSYNNELDSLRKIDEGVVALNENLTKVSNYKDLVYRERTCIEYCRTKPSDDDYREDIERCKAQCTLPRSLVHEDTKAKVENWRTDALRCLNQHSSENGDANASLFQECLNSYSDKLLRYGTNEENLNTWIQDYSKYFNQTNFQKKQEI